FFEMSTASAYGALCFQPVFSPVVRSSGGDAFVLAVSDAAAAAAGRSNAAGGAVGGWKASVRGATVSRIERYYRVGGQAIAFRGLSIRGHPFATATPDRPQTAMSYRTSKSIHCVVVRNFSGARLSVTTTCRT